MAEKRKRNERFVSPSGRFVYPWLTTPDTKFDADGVYRLKLAVAADEAAELVALLEEKYEANLQNNNAKVREEGARPWELDDATNEYLFTFKMKASVTTKSDAIAARRIRIIVGLLSGCTANELGRVYYRKP